MPIIVAIQGGLGNQMFQYAFALSLKQHDKKVLLDTSFYDSNNQDHNGYELEDVFHINENYASASIIKPYIDKRRTLLTRIGKYFLHRSFIKYYAQSTKKRFGYEANLFVYALDDAYFSGYWQSEKFFLSAKEKILDAYDFKHLELSPQNSAIENAIIQCNSVSIHLRRGDYVNHPQLGNICTENYYRKAIHKIKSMIDDPSFFVFSDDIAWCKEHLNTGTNATFIDWNKDTESFFDLYLMSKCKHNIIANSSFSWWAAYLNKHKQKVICAPPRWFKDERIDDKDIYQSGWLKIEH